MRTRRSGPNPSAPRPSACDPIPAALRDVEVLFQDDLKRRWSWGSEATFRRLETDGLLLPQYFGTRPGYFWESVFIYEGGLPPAGMEDAYREDLLTPQLVAVVRKVRPETIYDMVKDRRLPARRVGRFVRFVPAEIVRWLKRLP